MSADLNKLINTGRLPSWHILRGETVFQLIFQKGKVIPARYLVLRYRKVPDEPFDKRVGFIAGKRLGKAVKRNKVKRYMREAYRINKHIMADLLTQQEFGLHYLFMARTVSASFHEIEKDCCKLMKALQEQIYPAE